MGTTVAPHVQIQYARLEDALTVWAERDPTRPHRAHEAAGQAAVRLCGQLEMLFAERGRQRHDELTEYRERRM